MVAFPVGSSNRSDVFEHGLKAFTWLYGLWFCAPYYLPFMRRPVAWSIVRAAGYLDFTFPVLYLRSPMDRIASTAAFERLIRERPDCRMVLYPEYNHWFPEQHSDVVLPEVRTFVGG